MALTIRNQETTAAIRLLAARTGLTLTAAADQAVRNELHRLDEARLQETREQRLARMRRVAADVQHAAAAASGPWLTDDDLYDEDGLPR